MKLNYYKVKNLVCRRIALVLAIFLLSEAFYPSVVLALTSGPKQPEVQGFQPVGASDMVDLFTGDFSYNIPLLDVGGYPVNLAYKAGVSMDQEASWVGLGWSLNPGAIDRNMRGIPDDFKGEHIKKEFNLKPEITTSFQAGLPVQVFGLKPRKLLGNIKVGGTYNNYSGFSLNLGTSLKLGRLKVGLNYGGNSGLDIQPIIGFNHRLSKENHMLNGSFGIGYNSRRGLQNLSFNMNANKQVDNKGTIRYASGAGSYSFVSESYAPTPSMPMQGAAIDFSGTLGTALFGTHVNFEITGSYSEQRLVSSNKSQRAFGTLYSELAQDDPNCLMDFNKERPLTYREVQPKLPLSYGTYDLFSASGQGLNCQFRIMRNDVGTFKNPNSTMESRAGTLGVEIGAGGFAHFGMEAKLTSSSSKSGGWNGNIGAAEKFRATPLSQSEPLYENKILKNTGEAVSESKSEGLRNILTNEKPIKLSLNPNRDGVSAGQRIEGTSVSTGSPIVKRSQRQKRNQVINYLTASEATVGGLDKEIKSYNLLDATRQPTVNNSYTAISRLSHSAHHISEMNILQADGSRYVYGIPAYNNHHREVSFAAVAPSNHTNGITSYTTNDASVSNRNGKDNFFDAQETPPYAHSYLLTSVLSSDYVDVGNDGISDDDIGTAVKINYSRCYDNFGWRTPYGEGTARFQVGNKADGSDDKAHYVYGQKEIWYVHSIETKTMVAYFYTSERGDALGVSNERGTKDRAKRLRKLDFIKLYSKADLNVPIKTVHFEYDYSLCKGIDNTLNSGDGKLTLKKVYFTYGNNTNGSFNTYKFEYNDRDNVYSLENYDRWGNYKNQANNPRGLSNTEFPYVIQDASIARESAEVWNLSKIELPSGSIINVTYEPDDYAYIQNKRAGQMFMIEGFGAKNINYNFGRADITPTMYNISYETNPYVIVGLEYRLPNIPNISDTDIFKKMYLEDVEKIYYSMEVSLRNNDSYERINGYMNIDYSREFRFSSDRSSVAIPIRLLDSGRHPIFKTAQQKMRLELPHLLFPGHSTINQTDFGLTLLLQIFGVFPEIYKTLRGLDLYMQDRDFCKIVKVQSSWIRLANPNYKKYGGGNRVKKISISNYWSTEGRRESEKNDIEYGQEFNYSTTQKGISGADETISSGVASYEPSIGNDENPFRNQISYEEKVSLAPNNTYYIEEPIGESLFPAPVVGYSKVTVRSLKNSDAQLTRTGTGYTVHQFYTAKDFPCKVNNTTKETAKHDQRDNIGAALLSLFRFDDRDMLGASQGYSIEVNDMHGKAKQEEVFNQNGGTISWTKYTYKQKEVGTPQYAVGGDEVSTLTGYTSPYYKIDELSNDEIPLVSPNGNITNGSIGVDMDVWHEMEENTFEKTGGGVSLNTEIFLFGAAVPIWPYYHNEKKQFRGSVTTKFIKRFGVLDKVTKMENGSTVTSENLLWDAETGQVLVTKTQNEFKDYLYQTTIPAHWAYEQGMGMAYKNWGVLIENVSIAGGVIPNNISNYFVPGDELLLMQGNVIKHYANIVNIDNQKKVIDLNGDEISDTYDIKIIRSGRRNQQSATVGSIVSQESPINGNTLNIRSLQKVINAQANLFKDDWAINSGVKQRYQSHNPLTQSNTKAFLTLVSNVLTTKAGGNVISHGSMLDRLIPQGNGNLIDRENRNVPFIELTPTPTIPSDVVGLNLFKTYEAKIGDNCYLTIKSQNGSYFSICNNFNILPMQNSNECTIQMNCPTTTTTTYSNLQLVARFECRTCIKECIPNLAVDSKINPYRLGVKGNWRPSATYALYDHRTPSLVTTQKPIRQQGYMRDFSNYWVFEGNGVVSNPNLLIDNNINKWVKTNTITYYDQKGNELENVDALGIYSSALYRYKNTLAAAVSANARLQETAFDGFEDYSFLNPNDNCYAEHWNFARDYASLLSDKKSHTGKYSLRIGAGQSINKRSELLPTNAIENDLVIEGQTIKKVLPPFKPKAGKYVISMWVSKSGRCNSQDLANIAININNITFTPKGAVVEGWQRVEAIVDLQNNSNAGLLNIGIQNTLGDDIYIDDIRIHPFNAKMKSFVYDAVTLRLMAQLDENNYATFYEYDDEGSLVRTKKETERGVMTLQENRNFIRKNQ